MKFNPLLVAVAVLALLIASSGGLAAPPAGTTTSGSQPAMEARIAALESDLGALRAQVARLASADVRVPEPDGATSVFLKLAGIPGDSVRDGHEDEIEAFAWSWAALNPAEGHGVVARDIVVVKNIDKATARLFQACASGTTIPEATLTLRKSVEGEGSDYLVIKLTDVQITSFQTGIGGNQELVTLSAATVQIAYEGEVVAGWDFVASAPL